jgi:hypothetical protein
LARKHDRADTLPLASRVGNARLFNRGLRSCLNFG